VKSVTGDCEMLLLLLESGAALGIVDHLWGIFVWFKPGAFAVFAAP
jgi:hypothetical protein